MSGKKSNSEDSHPVTALFVLKGYKSVEKKHNR